MELIITLFLGIWIAVGGWLGYRSVKNEYSNGKVEDK